jgi:integrase
VEDFNLRAIPPGGVIENVRVDSAERQRVIDGVAKNLKESYVYPDLAQKMENAIRANQKRGEYDAITDPDAFANRLAKDLQAVSHDKHLGINYSPVKLPRIGEALGLMWSDIDWKKLKINIRRDWVDGQLGRPKSRASKAAVEMHETLAALLEGWRRETPYSKDSDFLFPSFKLHGKQPRLGSMIVQDYIRPAAIAAGVIPEGCPRFGFHNLRHGLSTFLIVNGHDPVVVHVAAHQKTQFFDHAPV